MQLYCSEIVLAIEQCLSVIVLAIEQCLFL